MRIVEKQKAIKLRRAGKTYSEILAKVPVAKSTLSLWLRDVGLAMPQKQRITTKRIQAARRGAEARRQTRLAEISLHEKYGESNVWRITSRELWLIGIALYWAEGSKQRESGFSTGLMIGNSDPDLLKIFLRWLVLMKISKRDIYFELYIHDTRKGEVTSFKQWWSKELHIPIERLDRVYLKRGNIKTKRTNTGDLYHGLLRIRVRRSTTLNRRVGGWVHGIVNALGSGVIGNTPAFGAGDSRIVP